MQSFGEEVVRPWGKLGPFENDCIATEDGYGDGPRRQNSRSIPRGYRQPMKRWIFETDLCPDIGKTYRTPFALG